VIRVPPPATALTPRQPAGGGQGHDLPNRHLAPPSVPFFFCDSTAIEPVADGNKKLMLRRGSHLPFGGPSAEMTFPFREYTFAEAQFQENTASLMKPEMEGRVEGTISGRCHGRRLPRLTASASGANGGSGFSWRKRFPMNSRLLLALAFHAVRSHGCDQQMLGWNNLGMHCMKRLFGVQHPAALQHHRSSSLLEANSSPTAPATRSPTRRATRTARFNSARRQGNFYDFVEPLYGAAVQPEFGLHSGHAGRTTSAKPCFLNGPTSRRPASSPRELVSAESIPITPYDDRGPEESLPP